MPAPLRPLLAALLLAAPAAAADPPGRVERRDPALDALIPPDSKLEVLAGGFEWAEGPVWLKDKKTLVFSDVERNTVYAWSAAEGVKEFLKPSGFTGTDRFTGREPGSNGLALDRDGHLLLCQHGDRRVARLEKSGRFATLADKYQGKRFNSPNDLVLDAKGDVLFTDPPYGLPGQMKDPGKQLPFQGVYRLKPSTGEVKLLTQEMSRPNGIGLSPDGKTLYVANSDPEKPVVMAFPVGGDGALGAGRLFFDAAELAKMKRPGLPDGLKVDTKGNVWATGPGGVLVLDPTGKLLGCVLTGHLTANCAFGEDGSTLFLTADDKLMRLRTAAKGLGFE